MDAAGGLVEWLDNRGLAGNDITESVAQSSDPGIQFVSDVGDLQISPTPPAFGSRVLFQRRALALHLG